MEEIKVSEMLQAESINKDDSVMIIQSGVNKKAGGSIQTATGTSLSLTSVADTCEVKSNSKNMFDESIVNNLWTFADGTISAWTGTCIQKYNCSEGDTFTLKATYSTTDTQNNIIAMAFFNSSNTLIGRTANNTTLEITSTAPANTAYMYAGHYVGKPTTIQLEEGSTATSYNPYNTEVKICGKNLFDKDNYTKFEGYVSIGSNKIVHASGNDQTLYIPIKSNTEYTISKISTTPFYVCTATDYANNTSVTNATNQTTNISYTITSGENDKYLCITYFNNTSTSTEQEILNSIQVEEGSTATTYEKFEGQYLDLIPDETKSAFTYDSLTNILSNGSVTIEYNTQSRLLNNDDTTAIKEYVDRTKEELLENDYDVYSTDEIRIGTWMDGKPLYRRVFIGTTNAIYQFTVISTILNASMVHMYGTTIKADGTGSVVAVPGFTGSDGKKQMIFYQSNTLQIYIEDTSANRNYKVIVEYTKTTD